MRGRGLSNAPVYLVAVLSLVLITVGCRPGTVDSALASGELEELTEVGDLAAAFDSDSGVPRLILSLSPT